MSVMPRESIKSRFGIGAGSTSAPSDLFEELEVVVEDQGVEFRNINENSSVQLVILWCSAFLFMLFVVSIIPLMHLTAGGNALAVIIGLVILGAVAMYSQARLASTTIRLSVTGIEIEQGTMLDRERIEIAWSELQGVELEPVDPKQEKKGMHLELRVRDGEPVHALAGVSVGDLNGVRQAVLKARRGSHS